MAKSDGMPAIVLAGLVGLGFLFLRGSKKETPPEPPPGPPPQDTPDAYLSGYTVK